jgi:hypothetical protein
VDTEVDMEVDVAADVLADSDGNAHEGEAEDSSDNSFDVGEGSIISNHLSLRTASESGQSGSGSGTEDDPVGPVMPSAGSPTIPHHSKATNFSRTISSDSTDLDDKEWVDPMPIPPMPLEPAPPIIAKTKSSSSAKGRKRKEPHVHVPSPSSIQEGILEDRPRHIPQMSTVWEQDGGWTQSGGIKGIIAPDPRPAGLDDPDGNDF